MYITVPYGKFTATNTAPSVISLRASALPELKEVSDSCSGSLFRGHAGILLVPAGGDD